MSALSNYPVMSQSQWKNAPFNQEDPKPLDVEVVVSNTLSKQLSVCTCDYTMEEWEDTDRDDEGHLYGTHGVDYNYDSCNFISDYKEEHLTLPQILEKAISHLIDYKNTVEALYNKGNQESNNAKKLKTTLIDLEWLIDEASDWTEDELEVVTN